LISYCITVYNEAQELVRLIASIRPAISNSDEIVIVQTHKNEEEKNSESYQELKTICERHATKYSSFHFENNFADLKNYMNSLASGQYIINLDADETMIPFSLEKLRSTILENDIDLYYLPRINIVTGITQEDIQKWSWKINERGWINWPDYQPRIYKNNESIKWVSKVHEHLEGFQTHAMIEADGKIAIVHKKTIDKQRQQNELYSQIGSN
jgi:glycosyltransferase involved in cell wall biosynthesis